MGYEETRFVGDIDQEFMCSICTLVLEDAMQSPCDHLFCKECIIQWLAADRSCPVERRTLEVADLKPVARFFRNVLARLMIKCDFEQQGCDKVVQLEQLQSHLLECTRNPNAEVVCDKGCNMTMRRHEYEMNDCLTHFSSGLTEKALEIARLNALANCLQEENQHMNDELNRQREENRHINDANRRLQEENQHTNDELNRQREENRHINVANRRLQEENQRMSDELNRQREENRQTNDANRRLQLQINHSPLKWHRSENIDFRGVDYNILEGTNKDRTGFAQLIYSIEQNLVFRVQILDWHNDSWMVIGLNHQDYRICNIFGESDLPIGYSSNGTIGIDSKSEKVGASWKNGDTIHCGIKISENPDNKGENFNAVVFLQNGKSIGEKRIEMPSDRLLYPTFCMFNCKVKRF